MKKSLTNKEWMKNWFTKELLKTVAIFAGVFIIIIILLNVVTRHNSEFEVPDFSGMNIEHAKEIADDASLSSQDGKRNHISSKSKGWKSCKKE